MRRTLCGISALLLLAGSLAAQTLQSRPGVLAPAPQGAQRQAADPAGAPTANPSLAELNATYARLSRTMRVAKTNEFKNPAALELPDFATVKVQKAAADADAGQIMSAPGGAPLAGASGPAAGGMLTQTRVPAVTGPQQKAPGVLSPNASMACMTTAISAINRAQSGVIFTPDMKGNLYTITGCGFGSTAGKLFLEGGPGAFPAHNGKLPFVIRTWNDRGIVAMLEPSIAGEFDQDNVKLVVETAQVTRGRLQSGPHRFIAARGQPVAIPVFPKSAFCATPASAMNQWCPAAWVSGGVVIAPCGTFGLNDCSIEVFRQHPFVNPAIPQVDHYTPKLKPGFVISSVIIQVATFKPDDSVDIRTVSPTINAKEVFIKVPIFADPIPTGYDSLYGVKFFAVGPAGIANPLVDGQ